jgi:hypothetical protein
VQDWREQECGESLAAMMEARRLAGFEQSDPFLQSGRAGSQGIFPQ